jgi:hypothetical protein
MIGTRLRILRPLAITGAICCAGISANAATVTHLEFVGGCPTGSDSELCSNGGNASEASVAAILGIDEELVTQLDVSDVDLGDDSRGRPRRTSQTSGEWSVSDPAITHLAFKADGFHILAELTSDSGTWSTDILDWSPTFTTVVCPAEICGIERYYALEDFRTVGGTVPDLSNIRAFSVVPVPAAAWLFGSALGLLAWMRSRAG